MKQQKEFLTTKEAAEMLRVSIPTLRERMENKGLPYIKHGRRLLFNKQHILNWINERRENHT